MSMPSKCQHHEGWKRCRKVQALLGQYKQARDAAALVEGVLALLQAAQAMHLLPGFQAFVPLQDQHLLQAHCHGLP